MKRVLTRLIPLSRLSEYMYIPLGFVFGFKYDDVKYI